MRTATLVAACSALFSCATVPSGGAGVVLHMSSVDPKPLPEGVNWVGPLDSVEVYDLRAQEHSEDLYALAADGAPLEAHASIITFHPAPGEIVALARETGHDYYRILVQPVVRSSLRRVLGRYLAQDLTTPTIGKAEREVADDVARRLRSHHVIFDAITLRTLRISPDTKAYQAVVETSVKEQEALTAQELVDLARRQADAMRADAQGIAASHALIAPTLSAGVLDDAAQRAWTRLLTAPSTRVEVRPVKQPYILEVER